MTWEEILEEALKMHPGERRQFELDHIPASGVEQVVFQAKLEMAVKGKRFTTNRSGTQINIHCYKT